MNDAPPDPASEKRHTLWSYVLFAGTAGLLMMTFVAPISKDVDIRVIGANLPIRKIVAASGAQDHNVFMLREQTIENNLTHVPTILVTGVRITLPNTVTIHALLRHPVLGWRVGHALFLVDKYGQVTARVKSTSLPVLSDQTRSALHLGDSVPVNVVTTSRYALRLLPNNTVASFQIAPKTGLVIQAREGWAAVLGPGPDWTAKVITLNQVIKKTRAKGKRLASVDLRGHQPNVSFEP